MNTLSSIARSGAGISVSTVKVVWLLLLYLLSTWLVLGSLSSYQFQSRVNAYPSEDGKSCTVTAIIQKLEVYDNFQKLLDKIDADINSLNILIGEEANTIKKLRIEELETNATLKAYTGDIEKNLTTVLEKTEADQLEDASLDQRYGAVKIKSDSLVALWNQYQATRSKLNRLVRQIYINEKARAELETELSKKKALKIETGIGKNRITEGMKGLVTEVIYMRQFKFNYLAVMPSELLTLILTLSMGTLGSVISLTRAFFDTTEDERLSWFVLRPFLGMMTALAIFIFSKAGLIIASASPVSAEGANELNPFFISFLAIISGMMSEQAFLKIHSAGLNFFSVEGSGMGRWGLNLKAEIERQGKQIEDVASYLDAPMEQVTKWLDEKEPVPKKYQQLFCIWLQQPSRRLFSDLPPDGVT